MPSYFDCSLTCLGWGGAPLVGFCGLNHPIPLAVGRNEITLKRIIIF